MSQAMPSAPQTASPTATVPATQAVPVADAAPAQASAQEGPARFDSADDIAAFLDSEDAHQGEAAAETAQPDSQDQGPPPEQTEETPQQDQEAEAIAAPASWTKEEKEAFAKIPPDLKRTITRREAQRDAFVKTKAEETTQARQRHDQLLQWAQGNLDQAVANAQASIFGDYHGLDMIALQRERPDLYNQVDAEMKARMARLQAAHEKQREIAAYQAQEQAARQKAMAEQEAQKIPALMASIYGQNAMPKKSEWMAEAEKFLEGMGMPKEHIQGISHAYQVGLIAKAMRYDQLQANAASAARKVAQAPKVMKPAGAGAPVSGESEKQKAAWANLRRKPGSTEAIAGLLNSLE